MKNLNLILNIVLLVAVGVLYFLHFSSGKPETKSAAKTPDGGPLQIAYVNSDTIVKYYEFAKTGKDLLSAKAQKYEQDYRNRAIGLQNEFSAYQRNVNSMTLGQVRATEEDLAKKQQNLQLYQQRLNQDVMAEEGKLLQELYDRVTKYLEKYSNENGLQIVLKYDPTSDLLHASDALDISQDVIRGLNQEYAAESTVKGAKADTTGVKKKK